LSPAFSDLLETFPFEGLMSELDKVEFRDLLFKFDGQILIVHLNFLKVLLYFEAPKFCPKIELFLLRIIRQVNHYAQIIRTRARSIAEFLMCIQYAIIMK
jgi:hypothetical protein